MNDSTAIALGRERELLVMWGAGWELPGSRGRCWAGSAPKGLLPAQPSVALISAPWALHRLLGDLLSDNGTLTAALCWQAVVDRKSVV